MGTLRPEDLNISALPRTRLGHLKEEAVADLLQRAAWDYREVVEESKRLAATVEELTQRLEEVKAQRSPPEETARRSKDPDELARTLLESVRRAARTERESTRRDCELMLKKAARRAERIEGDAARRAEERMAQLGRLEALREEVIAHLRSALQTVAERYDGRGSGAVVPIRPEP